MARLRSESGLLTAGTLTPLPLAAGGYRSGSLFISPPSLGRTPGRPTALYRQALCHEAARNRLAAAV